MKYLIVGILFVLVVGIFRKLGRPGADRKPADSNTGAEAGTTYIGSDAPSHKPPHAHHNSHDNSSHGDGGGSDGGGGGDGGGGD